MDFTDKFRFSFSEGEGIGADALYAELDGWRCFFVLTDDPKTWEWSIQTGGGWGGYRDTTENVVTHASGKERSLKYAMLQCWHWLQNNGTYTRLDD